MSIAAAIRQMIAAGLSVEQALSAAEIMEAEIAPEPRKSSAAVRQQRYRDRQKAEAAITNNVTDITNVTRDEHRNDVTEASRAHVEYTSLPSEEVITPLRPLKGAIPPKAKSEASGSRLPEGWTPAPTYDPTDFGLSHEQHSLELLKFLDHWRSTAGAKGRKADWDATWRNWMRRAAADLPREPRPSNVRPYPDQRRTAREENLSRALAGFEIATGGRRER